MALSTTGIAGIVFVCVMVAIFLAALIYLYFSSRENGKRKGRKIELQNFDEKHPMLGLGSIEVVDETTHEKSSSLSIDTASPTKQDSTRKSVRFATAEDYSKARESKFEQYIESALNERERYLIGRFELKQDEWHQNHQSLAPKASLELKHTDTLHFNESQMSIKTQLDKLADAVSDINLTAHHHDSSQSKTIDDIKAYLEAIKELKFKLGELINRGSDPENELLENRIEALDNKLKEVIVQDPEHKLETTTRYEKCLPREVIPPKLIDHSASTEFVEESTSCMAAESEDDVVGPNKEVTDKDINLNLAHLEALSNELDETASSLKQLPEEEEKEGNKASEECSAVYVQDEEKKKEIICSPVPRENENNADLHNQHKIVEEVLRDIVKTVEETVPDSKNTEETYSEKQKKASDELKNLELRLQKLHDDMPTLPVHHGLHTNSRQKKKTKEQKVALFA